MMLQPAAWSGLWLASVTVGVGLGLGLGLGLMPSQPLGLAHSVRFLHLGVEACRRSSSRWPLSSCKTRSRLPDRSARAPSGPKSFTPASAGASAGSPRSAEGVSLPGTAMQEAISALVAAPSLAEGAPAADAALGRAACLSASAAPSARPAWGGHLQRTCFAQHWPSGPSP